VASLRKRPWICWACQKLINVTGDLNKFHQGVIRKQRIFERRFAHLLRPIFKKQTLRIAKSVEAGDLFFTLIVLEDEKKMVTMFKNQYRFVGDFWNEDTSARIRGTKSIKRGIEKKDAEGIFEQSYEEWLNDFALMRVATDISPATIRLIEAIHLPAYLNYETIT